MPNLFVHDIGVARDFLEAAGASGLNIKSGQHYGRKPVVCVKDAHIPDGAWLMQHGQVAIVQTRGGVTLLSSQDLGFWIQFEGPDYHQDPFLFLFFFISFAILKKSQKTGSF
ncbi:MAG: hypothetical protein A2418_00750 [Candidatus Brennerbacteria bacterium RIFOXYC1_FULL_41_11]|uniref:Uncharacterized protein n=1 Tax=Candidatus Brennerbacteria bacterium RIFOXYD1_FULL_41_16 TaxID=1797529 RepID=A0A1G1XLC7_9BACT|nr:MAG: hypothetical protein A2391_03655 [Candidatus Brennerbacteria bacterium RIFOXYB1_FULL_41_13]OGY40410.1 MAG: hypothetical protein A2418_00750 [Candidatus Brennerbacteria bacterium RIFOXYC1_FULL_41_11]OGY40839.1 MAG: hypothetical protein A2570_00285 [Candidatus Brennerbacteria bacterium RIFOXYD1_FULL_41_16]